MTSFVSLVLASGDAAVGGGTTALFGLLLVTMIVCLALEERIHAKKSVITGMAALICLFLAVEMGITPRAHPVLEGHTLHLPQWVLGIEWDVIAIILGSSLFVDVTSRSGIFTWVAVKLTKKTGGDPLLLLVAYGLLTVMFSAFLNNVTAMIIVGSLTAVSLRRLEMTDKLLGFLLVEGLLTNVGGLLTLISSVPNIIVGQAAKITFVQFFLVAAPYVVIATAATLLLAKRKLQITRLATEEQRAAAREKVSGFDENDGIEKRWFFNLSCAAFVLFILALATKDFVPLLQPLDMGFIAMAFGGVMLLIYKHEVDKFYAAVDWDLLGFFATLFVVIYVMEHAQVLAKMGVLIGKMIALGDKAGSLALLWAAAGFSSVTDNIPLSAMLAKILQSNPDVPASYKAMQWWSVVFGSNLGGNLTPIGSASTVVAVTIMSKHNVPLSFVGFVKQAAPFALLQLVIASGYILVVGAILS